MPNKIKTSGLTDKKVAIRNTNFLIGVNEKDDYGPTSVTGFYNGITPPTSGYTIYVHKNLQGPSIHIANNDSQCIFFLKSFGATGNTISEVLSWSLSRTDLWVQTSDLTTSDLLVEDGLTLMLDAGNPSSYSGVGTTWTDLAGTQQNITLVNSPTYTSSAPSYFTFNGSTQRGTGSGKVLESTGYTKSVWFYLNSTADNNLLSSDTGGHYMFFSGTNKLYSGHSNWAGFPSNYPSTATFNLSTWYNVSLTFNTTDGMKLYVNGSLDSSYTTIKTAFVGDGSTNVASYGAGNYLNGRIAKAYCYNRSLSGSEILQNYNAQKGAFGF